MRKLFFTLVVTLGLVSAQAQVSQQDNINKTIEPADTSAGLIAKIGSWYTHHLNYTNVTILMALESSFIPFPSEIVVPPAVYSACQEGSPLYTYNSPIINVLLVLLFATCGALLGALINYFIAFFLGRPFIYWFVETKFGHLCMLNSEKVQQAENYFVKHGNISTLIGRLIPVIRQLISIPAGLSKMKLAPFIFFTTLGAAFWNILLAILGYLAHGQQDLINKYSDELSWILLIFGGLLLVFIVMKNIKKKRNKNHSEDK